MVYFLFVFLWLGSCGYALWRGGRPERLVAILFLLASPLTIFLYSPNPWRGVQWGILAVDAIMLILLLVIALRAERYWPMGVAAMQLLQVMGHFLKLTDPAMLHVIYWISAVVWAYPMLLLLALGTLRHHARVIRSGPEPSWSVSSDQTAVPSPTR